MRGRKIEIAVSETAAVPHRQFPATLCQESFAGAIAWVLCAGWLCRDTLRLLLFGSFSAKRITRTAGRKST